MTMTFENDAVLFLTDARGVYIPRDFATSVVRECVTGVTDDQWKVLETGPDHEWYWETWDTVEQNAVIKDPVSKVNYTLYQDGDVWLIPQT